MDRQTIIDAFETQAKSCETLGSPFTARLCRLFANAVPETSPIGEAVFGWQGNPMAAADALALRLAGSLHALVLEERDAELAAVYPPQDVSDDRLTKAIAQACQHHSGFILERLKSAPQTNEVRRSSALIGGFLTIARLFGLPLRLSEIGASAGLNLNWDRYSYRLGDLSWGKPGSGVNLAPDWTGPAPEPAAIAITERLGCDLYPIDITDPASRTRLLSYIWADQQDRLVRTRAALAIAARHPPRVEALDALDFLERRLANPEPGKTHVIFHSIAWQYLPEAARARGEKMIAEAGARATRQAPLARLQMEADAGKDGAMLDLQVWPGGERHEIGRADFHGRWIKWKGWPD